MTHRVLTICRGGQVRSVALAELLAARGFDAFPVGLKSHRRALRLGLRWADSVCVVPQMAGELQTYLAAAGGLFGPRQDPPPVFVVDPIPGRDRWRDPTHPELRELLAGWLDAGGWQICRNCTDDAGPDPPADWLDYAGCSACDGGFCGPFFYEAPQ